jgi:hypothetical protein
MKRILAVLAIVTLIVPAVANAQTRSNPAVAQIVQRVIAGLSGGAPYRNQYAPQQIRRPVVTPYSAYQNGYAQGAADARRAVPYTRYGQYNQYGVNNGYRNVYPQNNWNQNNWNQSNWNRNNGFQPDARGTWRH